MSEVARFLQSTLLRKAIMSFTGLFLISFLVGHLAGNLQLLIPNAEDTARLQFNAYAFFMTTNPVVKLLSYVTYLAVLLHVVYSIVLTRLNRSARPEGYQYPAYKNLKKKLSASSNMGILGTFLLIFLVIHMRSFWFEMHWGGIPVDSAGHKDLYAVVIAAFSEGWYVLLYVISMFFLAYHLSHGFSAAFQSLGLYHKRYAPLIKSFGIGFSIIVPGLFALIPVVLYLGEI